MKIVLFFVFALIATNNAYSAQPSQNNNSHQPTVKGLMVDEIDPTDVLAIPADTSEVELDEEYEQLEDIEKEYKEKHHNQ